MLLDKTEEMRARVGRKEVKSILTRVRECKVEGGCEYW
jgi:hypothetical protein